MHFWHTVFISFLEMGWGGLGWSCAWNGHPAAPPRPPLRPPWSQHLNPHQTQTDDAASCLRSLSSTQQFCQAAAVPSPIAYCKLPWTYLLTSVHPRARPDALRSHSKQTPPPGTRLQGTGPIRMGLLVIHFRDVAGCTLPVPRQALASSGNMLAHRGAGVLCLQKSESTNSGATKPMPFLKSERTSYAGVAKIAHEKQWTVAVISWRTFLVHQPALLSAPH